jgi:hypothetical protein
MTLSRNQRSLSPPKGIIRTQVEIEAVGLLLRRTMPLGNHDNISRLLRVRRNTWQFARGLIFASFVAAIIDANVGRESTPNLIAFAVLLLGVPSLTILCTRMAFRRPPCCLLLLRPFGEARISDSLRALIRKRLFFLGLVLTFGDNNIKAPARRDRVLQSIFSMGSWMTAFFVPVSLDVTSTSDPPLLVTRLRSPIRLLWRWLISNHNCLVITSTSELWKETIGSLIEAVDLVVVDLSEIGTGTLWELEKLRRNPRTHRLIFLVSQGRVKDARMTVERFFPTLHDRLFAYREDGTLLRDNTFIALLDSLFTNNN